MKTISVAFIAALSLAAFSGCKKKGAEAGGATCEATVTKMMSMQGDEMFGQMPKEKQEKWKGKFTELMITACKEDKWPEPVLKCAADAKDKKEMDACGEKVGKEEQEKMMKRVEPFMQEMMADMGMGSDPAQPAATDAPAQAEPAKDDSKTKTKAKKAKAPKKSKKAATAEAPKAEAEATAEAPAN